MEEDEVTKLYNEASAAFAEKRFEESQEKYTQTLALCKQNSAESTKYIEH